MDSQLGVSPSQTLVSEQSERISNELQKDSNSAHFSEQLFYRKKFAILKNQGVVGGSISILGI